MQILSEEKLVAKADKKREELMHYHITSNSLEFP